VEGCKFDQPLCFEPKKPKCEPGARAPKWGPDVCTTPPAPAPWGPKCEPAARAPKWGPDVCTIPPAPHPSDVYKRPPAGASEAKYEQAVYESIDADEFARDVRRLQHKNKCTNQTCLDFISLFSQYVDGHIPAGFTECDNKLKQAAGVEVIELHGCSKCHSHVYGPDDKRTHCPCCGAARYDAKTGKPTEVFCYVCMSGCDLFYFILIVFCSHTICFDCMAARFLFPSPTAIPQTFQS